MFVFVVCLFACPAKKPQVPAFLPGKEIFVVRSLQPWTTFMMNKKNSNQHRGVVLPRFLHHPACNCNLLHFTNLSEALSHLYESKLDLHWNCPATRTSEGNFQRIFCFCTKITTTKEKSLNTWCRPCSSTRQNGGFYPFRILTHFSLFRWGLECLWSRCLTMFTGLRVELPTRQTHTSHGR